MSPFLWTVCVLTLTVTSPISNVVPRPGGWCAPEDRANARDQLADAERLGHVVVGAGVEAADLVGLLALGGEHDDRHERVAPAELLAHLVAVHVGQHQVEQHRVGPLVPGNLHALLAGRGREHPEALELERVVQPEHDVRLVLDDQDGLPELHPAGRPNTTLARQEKATGRRTGDARRAAPILLISAGYGAGGISVTGEPRHAMNAIEPLAGVPSLKRRMRFCVAGHFSKIA